VTGVNEEPSLFGLGLLCCGFPVGLALYAIGLRLACHLSEAPVPGFFKSVGVGLASLVLLLVVQWGVGTLTGVPPLAEEPTPQRAVSRLLVLPAASLAFVVFYLPALGLSVFQSVRVVLMQLIYAGLFVVGFLMFGMFRSLNP
jgi:hypothetical protein